MEVEAPFACPDLECSSVFIEMGLLRRHIKHEHLNTWSLRHSYIQANLVNVEIPKRDEHFAELKILTWNVGERIISSFVCRAAEWRRNEQWRRQKPARSRGAQPRNDGGNITELEEEETNIWTKIFHVQMKLSAQLESRARDLELATYCTLFPLRDNAIVIEMQEADRTHNDKVVNSPDAE